MKDELEQLHCHIDDIQVAMMTTRRTDGHLQSRAMATQKRADGADLWFVSLEDTEKLPPPISSPPLSLTGSTTELGEMHTSKISVLQPNLTLQRH